MAIKLYLDEDIDPLLAKVLGDRGFDCVSTRDKKRRGATDEDQLAFAASEGRVLLTYNIKDFVDLARKYVGAGKHHAGIIVSDHIPFRDLLRRMLSLMHKHASASGLADQLLWLQDYKDPAS